MRALKLISIRLTDIEIEKVMQRVDINKDGQISYAEFAEKFRDDKEFDYRMRERANNRLAEMKQAMVMHMVSPVEAFKMVSCQ